MSLLVALTPILQNELKKSGYACKFLYVESAILVLEDEYVC